jgi:hypothetical protein
MKIVNLLSRQTILFLLPVFSFGFQLSQSEFQITQIISDDLVIINSGSENGIKVGEVYQVHGQKSIVHPATGKIETRNNVLVGFIEIIKIEMRTSECKIIQQKRPLTVKDQVQSFAVESVSALPEWSMQNDVNYEDTIYSKPKLSLLNIIAGASCIILAIFLLGFMHG